MNEKTIVMGAGGHAKVCIELLRASGFEVAFAIGDSVTDRHCLGIPVLAGDDNLVRLKEEGYSKVFIAVGSNRLRHRLAEYATSLGFELVRAVSPHAVISPSSKLGLGIAIMAGAVINAEAVIGDLAIINTGATIDHDCVIGQATHIAPQSALAGNVIVGDRSFLGIGTKVIPEIEIGSDVVVGAGSVVVSNIASGVTAFGVPARAKQQ